MFHNVVSVEVKSRFLTGILLLLSSICFAQNVRDLNKSALQNSTRKSSSGSESSGRSGGSSNYTSGSSDLSGCGDLEGCGAALEGLVYIFIGIGKGIELLAKEETRLYKRNQFENRLFALEGNFAGTIGFRNFTKIQPQVRLHLGWFSFDYKQFFLFDNTGNFKSREFTTWFNLMNHPNFKLRTGIGSLYLNTNRETYFLYGMGIDILPNAPVRIEAWGNLTQAFEFGYLRPRQEIGLRVHYEFWEKGHLLGSVFTGVSNQLYYNKLNFPGADFGLNIFLSFHKFMPREKDLPLSN